MEIMQYYSPSSKETLTIVDRNGVEVPCAAEQMAWVEAHPDAVLLRGFDGDH